jgi:hypothetical protein
MSNNKQKTSIEWFKDEISIHLNFDQRLYLREIYEQAQAMEKKQCVDFALKCMFAHVVPSQATREVIEKLFDEYYKEQFGGE